MLKRLLPLLLAMVLPAAAQTADTLRVATYNLLNYPGTNVSARNLYFRTVLSTMQPDVLVTQEVTSASGVEIFLADVLNALQPGRYASAPFNDGPDSDNAFFYDTERVRFVDARTIATALRDIGEYRFVRLGSADTIHFFSVHLKASDGDEEAAARLAEVRFLHERLDELPQGSRFIVAGDFNIYTSSEPAYLELTDAEAPGQVVDPLSQLGEWHNNPAFARLHTQSPRLRQFGGGSIGGVDDRFDMILVSEALSDNVLRSSYTAYGNDGLHFNDSINSRPNLAVPDSVADALHYASDHLPVFCDFVFGAKVAGVSERRGNPAPITLRVTPNPAHEEVHLRWDGIGLHGDAVVTVRDLLGQDIAMMRTGEEEMIWRPGRIAGGLYLITVTVGDQHTTEPVIVR